MNLIHVDNLSIILNLEAAMLALVDKVPAWAWSVTVMAVPIGCGVSLIIKALFPKGIKAMF